MDLPKVSDDDLGKTITESDQPPLLVAFRKDQCTECDTVEGWLTSLAQGDLKNQFRLVAMNVKTCPKSAEDFGILSVPNLILFKGSADLRSGWIGPWGKGRVRKFLQAALKAPTASASTSPKDYAVQATVLTTERGSSTAVPAASGPAVPVGPAGASTDTIAP